MRIESYIEHSAASSSDKTALVCGHRRLTYAELNELCERLAQGLREQGVGRSDRVAVYMPNSVESVVAIFAILKAGATFVMVNPSTKSEKLAYVLNDSRAKAVLLPARKLALIQSLGDKLPHLKLAVFTGKAVNNTDQSDSFETVAFEHIVGQEAENLSRRDGEKSENDLAAIIYTSGSTGRPKGVMHSHANLSAAIYSIAGYLQNTPDDVILNVLSLSFGYGLTQLLTAVKVGATLVLEESFTYSHAVMKRFAEERVTGFAMVPTIAAILLQMDLSKYDLSSLRYITNAGAAMPEPHSKALRNILPWVRIYLMYGQTECIRTSFLPPELVDTRPESVGRGIPGTDVCIVDAEGIPVPPDVAGELIVRGDNLMQGYWELPEETQKTLRVQRWPDSDCPHSQEPQKVMYTGDLFRADEDGLLYFVGRKDDIIKTKGEKVSPKEVENVLYSHPDIAEAVVFGVPDEILGEAVQAAVTLRNGSNTLEQEILRYCSQRLEDFMVPRSVAFYDTIPKTPNGKINKQELIGVASDEHAVKS